MRVALLGLGFMGRAHVAAIETIPQASLAAVYVRDPERLQASVEGNQSQVSKPVDLREARVCTRLEDILADSSLDAVDICLPTYLHPETTVAAVRARKHVLVEKPMAIDLLSAQKMIEEARQADRVLMVAHVLRFFPAYQVLGERVRNNSLGSLRSLVLRRSCAAPAWGEWFADSSKSGGATLDLLVHDADIALSLFGRPQNISATGYRDLRRGIDVTTAHLHYAGKLDVTILGGWHHPKSYSFAMGYTAVFDEGTLEYSSQTGNAALHRADGTCDPVPLERTDPYADEIRYFIECCSSGRHPERCPPEESAQAVSLCLQLGEARWAHGK